MIPEGQGNLPDLNAFRIRPTAHEQDPYTISASTSRRVTFEGLPAPAADAEVDRRGEHCAVATNTWQQEGCHPDLDLHVHPCKDTTLTDPLLSSFGNVGTLSNLLVDPRNIA